MQVGEGGELVAPKLGPPAVILPPSSPSSSVILQTAGIWSGDHPCVLPRDTGGRYKGDAPLDLLQQQLPTSPPPSSSSTFRRSASESTRLQAVSSSLLLKGAPPARSRREPEAVCWPLESVVETSHGSSAILIRNSKSQEDSSLGTGQMLGSSDCLEISYGWPQPDHD